MQDCTGQSVPMSQRVGRLSILPLHDAEILKPSHQIREGRWGNRNLGVAEAVSQFLLGDRALKQHRKRGEPGRGAECV